METDRHEQMLKTINTAFADADFTINPDCGVE